jgi:hypothetical protein
MTDDEITPEHTAARAQLVLDALEELRLDMGRVRDNRAPMQVREAAPREVFYHALTVHRKADQLAVELGARPIAPPEPKLRARATPADVQRVLEQVLERIGTARSLLPLPADAPRPVPPPAREPGKVASDTLYRCLVASRQLDAMLLHTFDSREAHGMLLRALGLMSALLKTLGAELPPEPDFVPRKFARDNFHVLWETCRLMYRTLTESGIKLVQISPGFVGEEPTDVYDLCSLIVSELEYVATLLDLGDVPPLALPEPKPVVLPPHNHRRARHLQLATLLLAQKVQANPRWLEGRRS